jgi:uncharacterized protein YbcI
LIQIHKDVTGRGPKDTYVRLFKRCIVFYLEDPLTALERQLLHSGWGVEKVDKLRADLLEMILPLFQEIIAEKVAVNIISSMTKVVADQQAQFGLIILDQDIEKIYTSVG